MNKMTLKMYVDSDVIKFLHNYKIDNNLSTMGEALEEIIKLMKGGKKEK